jgi:hypothetical protein
MPNRYGPRLRVSTQVRNWNPPSGFTPAQLNPVLWLDAADSSTITSGGSPTTVSQWTNKGSIVSNFTQGTAANQPTTGANTLNGLNVLDFDGGDVLVSSATAADWKFLSDGSSTYFICSVIQVGSAADPNAIYFYACTNAAASASVGAAFAFEDRSSISANNATRVLIANNAPGFAVSNINSNIWSPQTWVVVSHVIDASNATASERNTVRINQGLDLKTNTESGTPSTSNPVGSLRIGGTTSAASLVGKIGEMIIVSGAEATLNNRSRIIDYLNSKWNLF